VRPAGPGHGLWHRQEPLRREQAGSRGQVYRPAGQDHHDPLHPVHPLCAFFHRGRGCGGTGRNWPWRGHGDHHVSRKGAVLRDAGQRDRPVPCRRADVGTLRVQGPSVGIAQDRNHRRDGRGRLSHPCRCARARSDARAAASQRRGQRGVDLRQDPFHLGRASFATSGQALYPRKRQAARSQLGRGVRTDCRQAEGGWTRQDRSPDR
jgi:hypothetical protein